VHVRARDTASSLERGGDHKRRGLNARRRVDRPRIMAQLCATHHWAAVTAAEMGTGSPWRTGSLHSFTSPRDPVLQEALARPETEHLATAHLAGEVRALLARVECELASQQHAA